VQPAQRRLVSIALLVLAAAACGSPTSPGERDLEDNRRRFAALVGSSYSCDYRNVGFLIGPIVEPVRMTVRRSQVVSLVSRTSGEEIAPELRDAFLSVEEVFDEIQRARDQGAFRVEVEYDAELGYPRETYIDYDSRIADEERGFSISGLTPGG
jgi:hypothetical protein